MGVCAQVKRGFAWLGTQSHGIRPALERLTDEHKTAAARSKGE